jgi:hypothetical protein
MYVRQVRQRPHDGMCMYVNVNEFTRAHVRDEETPACGVERGVVEPDWATR